MTNKVFCYACGGEHEPDPPDCWVDFRGYRFHPPFKCMCCGKEICARQFAFGRCCGPCDMGACQTNNRAFPKSAVHDHPSWWGYDGNESFRQFVQTVGAQLSPDKEEKATLVK